MPGTIYLVATPLGNLDDITLRALKILKQVDVIACEDTRRTRRLLTHFEIKKPLKSCHEHNEAQRADELVERALEGEDIALVTDAGMPCISDPGYRVVRRAIKSGVNVVPIPGPVAIETALAASGLPSNSFRFGGFLPSRKTQRLKTLESLSNDPATLVFYEAPHRIVAALSDVVQTLGQRQVVVAREMTKLHEEFLRGTAGEVLETLKSRGGIKGEITLLIARAADSQRPDQPIEDRVGELIEQEGLTKMEAIKRAARERGVSKSEAYRLLEHRRER